MVKYVEKGFLASLIMTDEEKNTNKLKETLDMPPSVNNNEKFLFKRYAKELKILDEMTKLK